VARGRSIGVLACLAAVLAFVALALAESRDHATARKAISSEAKPSPAPRITDFPRPRVAESPVSMECRLLQIVEISAQPMGGNIVIGEVVRFHVDDRVIVPGDAGTFRIDAEKLRAIGRMSGYDYARTRDRFSLVRP